MDDDRFERLALCLGLLLTIAGLTALWVAVLDATLP